MILTLTCRAEEQRRAAGRGLPCAHNPSGLGAPGAPLAVPLLLTTYQEKAVREECCSSHSPRVTPGWVPILPSRGIASVLCPWLWVLLCLGLC